MPICCCAAAASERVPSSSEVKLPAVRPSLNRANAPTAVGLSGDPNRAEHADMSSLRALSPPLAFTESAAPAVTQLLSASRSKTKDLHGVHCLQAAPYELHQALVSRAQASRRFPSLC
jgi:hypothetical protein